MSFILGLTIAYACEGHMNGRWIGTLCASLSLSLVVAAGYAFNDVCDRSIDRINAPQRPIAAGSMPEGLALLWAVTLAAVGLTAGALTCRPAFTMLLAVIACSLAVYDLTAKHLGLGKQLFVAALMASIYPLAIAQAGLPDGFAFARSRITTLLFFPVWLFLTSFGYEILKDIRDVAGDRAATRRTNWISARPDLARRTASKTIMIGAAFLVIPAFTGCGTVYAMIVPAAILAAFVSVLLPLRLAMIAIYAECVIVGIAAMADLLAT